MAADPPDVGAQIYQERCASCHGVAGEGVGKEHAQPLEGEKSVEQLTRYIAKNMPEDKPGTCVGPDAESVARYIHDTFYSAIARARKQPARKELSRLTVRQYANAVLDLVGSFRTPGRSSDQHGLRAQYSDAGRPGRDAVLERLDSEVRFDFGKSPLSLDNAATVEKFRLQGFSARWEGSLHAPDTGTYELIIRTDQAARLWLNDSEKPLIDVWVKSGSDTDHRAAIYLLGGRSYPIKLELTSRTQGVEDKKKENTKPVEAFIELH